MSSNIDIHIAEITNTGNVRVELEPGLSSTTLDKIVADDIVVTLHCLDETERAFTELAFTY